MANFKYFADLDNGATIELKSVFYTGKKAFGTPMDFTPVWTGTTWDRGTVAATRAIEYAANPSKHVCDARCANAKGHKCECACGGANHGKGA